MLHYKYIKILLYFTKFNLTYCKYIIHFIHNSVTLNNKNEFFKNGKKWKQIS